MRSRQWGIQTPQTLDSAQSEMRCRDLGAQGHWSLVRAEGQAELCSSPLRTFEVGGKMNKGRDGEETKQVAEEFLSGPY